VKPVEQNDLALKNGFLIFSELAERTQTSGSSQGIGDRAASGVTRNGQTAVLAEHSSEGSAQLALRAGSVGGEVRPKRAAVAKVKSGITFPRQALWETLRGHKPYKQKALGALRVV
jgi:hypothetical protein